MKQNLCGLCMSLIFSFAFTTGFSQNNGQRTPGRTTPKWASALGYWVVVNNIHSPDHNTVFIYDNQNTMIYQEKLNGIELNLNKRRTKMFLKKLVDKKVTAHLQKSESSGNEIQLLDLSKK